MNIMNYWSKFLCLGLCLIVSGSVVCQGQENEKEVVYRDYMRMEADLLDSLKRDEVKTLFCGVHALRLQAQQVKESTLVRLKPRRAEKKKLSPQNMIERRKGSVLTVNKYHRAMIRPEEVTGWATAVVLSEDGICVSNYHVFWEFLDTTAKLNPQDSIMFVATEEGRVYPITEILSFNKTADMTFFKVDTRGDVLTPIPLGNDLPAGTGVHLLSHPEGYPYAYTNGVVMRTTTSDAEDPFARRMELTIDYAKGASGGPIMDDCGNMVAMVSSIRAIFYSNQPPYSQQMNVKLTIPVSLFRRLIQDTDK
ncbi:MULTISPECIES: S1 family peptidase [Butyricimonas]|jgi:serine protease Do|uniref:S1 family peptidase n=1 Tax=Butyricimonas TaxID=574697 RepID=UPI00241F320C|nr:MULTISPECIES: serine protease [Butyricimonas]